MLKHRSFLLGLRTLSSVFETFSEIVFTLSQFLRFLGQYLRVCLIFFSDFLMKSRFLQAK